MFGQINTKYLVSCMCLLFLLFSCGKQEHEATEEIINPTFDFQPNILWLVTEDQSPTIPAYGDSTLVMPVLDRLAAEGVCYDNFFSPAPVCAPARAAIITGMYPNHIGAGHMRTGPWMAGRPTDEVIQRMSPYFPEGIPPYEAVPGAEVRMFTEYLRQKGLFTSNRAKEDYQFVKTHTAWDESNYTAHWRHRKPGQAFFSVINFGVTHESQVWGKANDSLWVDEELDVPVPPYLPDTEIGKTDIRRMYSNLRQMDFQVGEVLTQLEEDGLLDSTIVIWYSDHGGPLPRQKRLLYDAGIKVPMIIRFPNKMHAGKRDNRMISFIDLAPTVLSLFSIPPPEYMDGTAFLGKYMRKVEPAYVFAAADRFDEVQDNNRAVRDERFKYIHYYRPDKPMFLPVSYREQMPIMQELHRLKEEGLLSPAQALWFRDTKPEEELFDLWEDPFELTNLADEPAYQEKLIELRAEEQAWVGAIDDTGLMDEKDLLQRIWPQGKQPVTADPKLSVEGGRVVIQCATQGASIGYQLIPKGKSEESGTWQVYVAPFGVPEGMDLLVKCHRLGYLPSAVVRQGF